MQVTLLADLPAASTLVLYFTATALSREIPVACGSMNRLPFVPADSSMQD
jgi:hypothetical protein